MVTTNSIGEQWKFNGKEKEEELGLNTYDFGARMYMPDIVRTPTVDPLADDPTQIDKSPYAMFWNNPISNIDPTGMMAEPYDWVEREDGTIYWDENAVSQATTKEGETYLGKNVLVGTHNRDATGNEAINTATFDLYLESDKTGPTATIMGNTVPADITKYGTLAEGLYSAEYTTYKGDSAILIGKGKGLPTVSGNPNNPLNYNANGSLKPIGQHIMDNILFHKGNWARESLFTNDFNNYGNRILISKGCQTGGCGNGSLPAYRRFIKKTKGFVGSYYLRSNTR
jgi:RHS repeat-associated protein